MGRFHARMRKQLVLLFYASALAFAFLGYRLVQIQAKDHDRYTAMAERQHRGRVVLPAIRGPIVDRHGRILASSVFLPSVAANPGRIINPAAAANALAPLVGKTSQAVLAAVSQPGGFVWIARKIDRRRADQIQALHIPGVLIIKEPAGKRFYPNGRLASHVLGCTGIDDQGLDGVESVCDASLEGIPGHAEEEIDPLGHPLPGGFSRLVPAEEGQTVELTIDEHIQHVAERQLAAMVASSHAKGGTVIVMEVPSGEILALANAPDFPAGDLAAPHALRRNGAVSDAYEPGSTFKTFLAAAAIDSGKASLDDVFPCGNTVELGGWSIHNANDGLSAGGSATLREIVKNSYNTGAANVGLRIGRDTLGTYARKFGFGRVTGVDLPGEAEGILTDSNTWSPITLATVSFGQGVSVTPIQIVAAMGAIANGGRTVHPHVVRAIHGPGGEVTKQFQPPPGEQILSPATVERMKGLLQLVVTDGTGKHAQIPGYAVAGKTGTAQMVAGKSYASGRFVASFIGFVPADRPRLVILAKVDEPTPVHWGGVIAAPVFAAVAQRALWELGVPPRQPADSLPDLEAAPVH